MLLEAARLDLGIRLPHHRVSGRDGDIPFTLMATFPAFKHSKSPDKLTQAAGLHAAMLRTADLCRQKEKAV
ncbi:MAG: hypothetical protein M0Z47_00500 [Actinomycetota bacterium]|nr:hypothetical protein [Actinomycetota bacterium]